MKKIFVAQAGLILTAVLLAQPSEHWECRLALPHPSDRALLVIAEKLEVDLSH